MKRRRFLLSPLALMARPCAAQAPYPPVVPGRALRFPDDYGSHPDFRTEWWYITGWMRDAAGNDYGMQVTFFRNRPRIAEANASRFAPTQLLFAHAALADPKLGRLRTAERAARAVFDLAQASTQQTDVWIDDWSLRQNGEQYRARIAAEDFAFDLAFTPTQPVMPEGVDGYSQKDADPLRASYYYSQPQLALAGEVGLRGNTLAVTGRAWLDHEWSSESLAESAVGWDWTGINLDNGSSLMAFRMRGQAGSVLWGGGTLRGGDGTRKVLRPQEVRFAPQKQWRSPRTQATYPTEMLLGVDGSEYLLQPLIADQELDARASTGTVYWEGAVRALQQGREVGRGYLELTGYWRPLKL